MFDVILAMTNNNGIGFNNKLPWHSKEELSLFKKITMGKSVIMGRKTSLRCLKGRKIFSCYNSIDEVLKRASDEMVMIAGGAEIYNEVFSNYRKSINNVYLSIMKEGYKCDKFIRFNRSVWTIKSKVVYTDFTHYVLNPKESDERQYLDLLKYVTTMGIERYGRNGLTQSIFGSALYFDLTRGFPLITTKKMFFRGIVEELLFFIRGDTDTTKLEEKKVNIWSGNTNRTFLDSIHKNKRRKGVMGPMYGYQWRNYNAQYDEENASPKIRGLDQLRMVVEQIRNDPNSRRILLTDYNPLQARDGVLYPCHSIILQFYVINGYLDVFCFNRSSDLFHGLPFNIASTALFQMLIAKITGLTARKLMLTLGDAHIYSSHIDVVKKQLNRIPYASPQIFIKSVENIEDIESLKYEDFVLDNYMCDKSLKAKMVI